MRSQIDITLAQGYEGVCKDVICVAMTYIVRSLLPDMTSHCCGTLETDIFEIE